MELRSDYMKLYEIGTRKLTYIKIPCIVLSSVGGLASFGSSNFPSPYAVSLAVGCMSLFVSTLNSIEAYFGWSGIATNSKVASMELQTIIQKIDLELVLPEKERIATGISFVRDIFNQFLQLIEKSPMISGVREKQDRLKSMSNRLSCSPLPSHPNIPEDV